MLIDDCESKAFASLCKYFASYSNDLERLLCGLSMYPIYQDLIPDRQHPRSVELKFLQLK